MVIFFGTLFIKFIIPHLTEFVSFIQISFIDFGLGFNSLSKFFIVCADYALDPSVIGVANSVPITDTILVDTNIHPRVARLLAKQVFINNQLEVIRNLPSVAASIHLLPVFVVESFLLDWLTKVEIYEIQLTYIPNKASIPLSIKESCNFINVFVDCNLSNTYENLVRVPLDISIDLTVDDIRNQARRIMDHGEGLDDGLLKIVNKFANLGSVNLNKVASAKSSGLLHTYVNCKHI